jgi:type III secretion protein R
VKGELSLLWALGPLSLLVAACFLKFSVVLSLLGRALGGRTLPSLAVTGVALLLCAFVLAPVVEQSLGAAGTAVVSGDLIAASSKVAEPVRAFLDRQVSPEARRDLVELQRGLRPPDQRAKVGDRDLVVLGPAFALAELKTAFRIGFFLLLPFLVIDLLIAVVLLAVGMHTLDARVVALPLKLLLFIAVDGWALIAKGLLVGYTGAGG